MPPRKSTMKPLLQFIQEIARVIHTDTSDEKVAAIIKENFSPDLFVDENEASLAFAGFKAFNTDFRKEFRTLEIKDSKAVTFKADSEGLGRIVGFASTFLFEQKINGQMSAGDTVEIFEVTFFPSDNGKAKVKRLITKSFATIGDKTPIPSNTGDQAGSTKVQLTGTSQRSGSDGVSKRRSTAANRVVKKRSSRK